MTDKLVCTICSAPGRFLTSAGVTCPTCALLTAIFQHPADTWLPVLIQPDGSPREHGQVPSRVMVSA